MLKIAFRARCPNPERGWWDEEAQTGVVTAIILDSPEEHGYNVMTLIGTPTFRQLARFVLPCHASVKVCRRVRGGSRGDR